jgi:hypothetical protein
MSIATETASDRHIPHPRTVDLTGRSFGLLTVIEMAEVRNGRVIWLCRCECGKEIKAAAYTLRGTPTKVAQTSCGCQGFLASLPNAAVPDAVESGDVREIPLTRGHVALVDACDYEWAMQWRWNAQVVPDSTRIYARRMENKRGVFLHREILIRKLGRADFQDTDHHNRNTLDNTRINLRAATRGQNNHNRSGPLRSKKVSRFKNIGYDKRNQKPWLFYITINGRKRQFGGFTSEAEAVTAYSQIAPRLTNGFARGSDDLGEV